MGTRRYVGRGMTETVVSPTTKKHVDMKKALYFAKTLDNSNEKVTLKAILGDVDAYYKAEVKRLEARLNALYRVDDTSAYAVRFVGDTMITIKADSDEDYRDLMIV